MGEPIRCLVVISSLAQGGAEYQALLTAEALSSVGVESHLFVCSPPLHLQSELEEKKVALSVPPRREGRLLQLVRLANTVESFRPDVTITFMYSASARFLATRAASRWARRSTWIVSERGYIHLGDVLHKPLARRVREACLRSCDLVAVNSPSLASSIFSFAPSVSNKVAVVPNIVVPFSPDRAAARELLRPLLPAGFSGTLLGSIGSFQGDRNHALLLESFVLARRKLPAAHLIVMGRTTGRDCDASASRFRQRVKEARLSDCVTIAGEVPRARHLLAGLDVVVFPSRLEGSSNALVEAIISGAAIASAPFADAETLLAGAGIVAKGWTPATLAEAMLAAVASRERLGGLASARGAELLAQRSKEQVGLAWRQVAEATLVRRREQA